jgi:hypothetical protein
MDSSGAVLVLFRKSFSGNFLKYLEYLFQYPCCGSDNQFASNGVNIRDECVVSE